MPAAPFPDPAADQSTAAEVRSLRAEIGSLRAMVADSRLQAELVHLHLIRQRKATQLRHGWLRYVVKDLETNPHTQYKVHFWGVCYWLVNFPLIIALFFLAPGLWVKLGVFITLIYSIYANMATDYGAMSAAMAAFGDPLPPVIPLEAPPAAGDTELP